MRVKFGDKKIKFPDDMSEEEINAVLEKEMTRAKGLAQLFQSQEGGPAPRMGQGEQREFSTQEKLDTAAMTTMGLPVVGDIAGLAADAHMYATDEGSRNWINYLFTAAGMLPAIPAASQIRNMTKKITAYHGSPHDFDKFSMDAIGTGEGAQAYGHGLYFAESEDVADVYRQSLTDNHRNNMAPTEVTAYVTPEGRVLSRRGDPETWGAADIAYQMREFDVDPATEEGMEWLESELAARAMGGAEIDEKSVMSFYKNPAKQERHRGRMYQVEIDATPDELLDWDAPLSEQPEKVKDWARQNIQAKGANGEPVTLGEIETQWRDAGLDPFGERGMPEFRQSGHEVYTATNQANKEGATDLLRKAGIKGIKYKDGFSRGTDGGTSNYVIFDDRLISIAKKYGIAIPAAAALLAKQTGEDTEQLYREDI